MRKEPQKNRGLNRRRECRKTRVRGGTKEKESTGNKDLKPSYNAIKKKGTASLLQAGRKRTVVRRPPGKEERKVQPRA